jgi:hypothetical protein
VVESDLIEFHCVRSGQTNCFGHTVLLDKTTDNRAPFTIDAGFDPWIIADRDEAGLDRRNGAVGVFAEEDVAIIEDVNVVPADQGLPIVSSVGDAVGEQGISVE